MVEYHPVVEKIKALLDEHGVDYKTFEHEAVRTSEEAAELRPEYSLSQGTKALILRIKKKSVPKEKEKQFVQIVVPGDAKFNPAKARAALNAKDIRFATEAEVAEITEGVQPGGVPPFGNIFGLEVFMDQACLDHDESIFNAGDRRYSIAVKSADLVKVVQPNIVDLVSV